MVFVCRYVVVSTSVGGGGGGGDVTEVVGVGWGGGGIEGGLEWFGMCWGVGLCISAGI